VRFCKRDGGQTSYLFWDEESILIIFYFCPACYLNAKLDIRSSTHYEINT
jgi:hypothetical protein